MEKASDGSFPRNNQKNRTTTPRSFSRAFPRSAAFFLHETTTKVSGTLPDTIRGRPIPAVRPTLNTYKAAP